MGARDISFSVPFVFSLSQDKETLKWSVNPLAESSEFKLVRNGEGSMRPQDEPWWGQRAS